MSVMKLNNLFVGFMHFSSFSGGKALGGKNFHRAWWNFFRKHLGSNFWSYLEQIHNIRYSDIVSTNQYLRTQNYCTKCGWWKKIFWWKMTFFHQVVFPLQFLQQ